MDGEQNGTQAQQVEQQQENQTSQHQTDQQETQGKHAKETVADAPAGGGVGAEAYEKQLAERDSRIAELEAQIADSAKNVETADGLRAEIAALKEQGESVCAMAHTDSYVLSAVMCRDRRRRCPWRGPRHITNRLLP